MNKLVRWTYRRYSMDRRSHLYYIFRRPVKTGIRLMRYRIRVIERYIHQILRQGFSHGYAIYLNKVPRRL